MKEATNKEQQLKNNIIAEMATSDVEVKDKQDLEKATDKLRIIQNLRKQVNEYWGELIKAAHSTWKNLNNKKKEMLRPIETVENVLKEKINVYLDEEEKKRQGIQAKIKADIQKQREIIKAEMEKETGEEQKEILEMQADLISQNIVLPQKNEKISQRYVYDYEVTDESKIPREYLMINEIKIKQKIREQKEDTKIPGIKVIKKRILITTKK